MWPIGGYRARKTGVGFFEAVDYPLLRNLELREGFSSSLFDLAQWFHTADEHVACLIQKLTRNHHLKNRLSWYEFTSGGVSSPTRLSRDQMGPRPWGPKWLKDLHGLVPLR